jgi:(E)-4-hydroxy-3-methylbut-2-enyl-diphosphate synthase
MSYPVADADMVIWESVRECLEVSYKTKFDDIILSFKASDAKRMISANPLACNNLNDLGWNRSIHLGVTESGNADYARIKSAIGIGVLLADGIEYPIRLSLTEDPRDEIDTAKNMLQACGVKRYCVEIVACPSYDRTSYEIQSVLGEVRIKMEQFPGAQNLTIGVLGCIVNGLGEAGDADFAIIGSPNGTMSINEKQICIVKNIPPQTIRKMSITIVNHCLT